MRLAPSFCALALLAVGCTPAESQGGLTLEKKMPVTFAQLSNVVELGDGRVAFADTRAKLFLAADLQTGKLDTLGTRVDSLIRNAPAEQSSANRASASSGSPAAASPQATPQPAMGIPVHAWTARAKPPSQSALHWLASPNGQKGTPPLRECTSSLQRNSDQSAVRTPSATSAASEPGVGLWARGAGACVTRTFA